MKQYAVIFSPRAEEQLGNLYIYIAEHAGKEQAERYVSSIVEFCQRLSTFPERGTKRDDVRLGLRIIGYTSSDTWHFLRWTGLWFPH